MVHKWTILKSPARTVRGPSNHSRRCAATPDAIPWLNHLNVASSSSPLRIAVTHTATTERRSYPREGCRPPARDEVGTRERGREGGGHGETHCRRARLTDACWAQPAVPTCSCEWRFPTERTLLRGSSRLSRGPWLPLTPHSGSPPGAASGVELLEAAWSEALAGSAGCEGCAGCDCGSVPRLLLRDSPPGCTNSTPELARAVRSVHAPCTQSTRRALSPRAVRSVPRAVHSVPRAPPDSTGGPALPSEATRVEEAASAEIFPREHNKHGLGPRRYNRSEWSSLWRSARTTWPQSAAPRVTSPRLGTRRSPRRAVVRAQQPSSPAGAELLRREVTALLPEQLLLLAPRVPVRTGAPAASSSSRTTPLRRSLARRSLPAV
ncbi:unnamed protein product [Lampetra fluviatilis]